MRIMWIILEMSFTAASFKCLQVFTLHKKGNKRVDISWQRKGKGWKGRSRIPQCNVRNRSHNLSKAKSQARSVRNVNVVQSAGKTNAHAPPPAEPITAREMVAAVKSASQVPTYEVEAWQKRKNQKETSGRQENIPIKHFQTKRNIRNYSFYSLRSVETCGK